jgi:hypothetical protein
MFVNYYKKIFKSARIPATANAIHKKLIEIKVTIFNQPCT